MLDERFRSLKTTRAPNLWPDIEHREPRPPRREVPWGRLGTAAVAFAVAAAGIAFAARAFFGEDGTRPGESDRTVPLDFEEVNPRVSATIPVGPFPSAIAFGEGGVWVGVPYQDGSGRGEVVRIDPRTNEVVARIELDFAPSKIATGSGGVWVTAVTNSVGPNGSTSDFKIGVMRIEPATNSVTAMTELAGGYARDIEVGEGEVWIGVETGNREGQIFHLDPSTLEEGPRIDVGDAPYRVVLTGGAVWAITGGPDGIVRIDPNTAEITGRADFRSQMSLDAAAGEGAVWTGGWLSQFEPSVGTGSHDRVLAVRIDAASLDVTQGRVFEPPDDLFRPFAVGAGGVWFLGREGVARLNPDTMEIDAAVPLEAGAMQTEFGVLDESSGSIWIAQYRDTVTRIDLLPAGEPTAQEVGAPVAPRVAGNLPIEFASSAASGFGSVWVAQSANDGTSSGWIHRIDPATGETIARIPVDLIPGWEVDGGGMAAGAGSLWVAGGIDGTGEPGLDAGVMKIDPSTNSVVDVVNLGGRVAADVAVDANGVWISLFGNQDIEVVRVDPVTMKVVARIPMESEYARELLAVGGTVWVRERGTHGSTVEANAILSQIDPATNSIVRSVSFAKIGSVSVYDGMIWAQQYGYEAGDELLRIDPHTGQQVGEPIHYSGQLEYIAGGEGGIWGVTALEPPASLVRIDVSSGTAHAEVDLDREEEPIDVVVGPDSIWILDYVDSVIWIELRSG